MSIGVWQPAEPVQIGLDKLRGLVEIISQVDLENLTDTLPREIVESDKNLMQCQPKNWAAADGLNNDELTSLIRFFTLAEMQLSGWDGGKLSPVIYLVKILKQRSAFDSELRQWVKANTDNRYLPNGAVL